MTPDTHQPWVDMRQEITWVASGWLTVDDENSITMWENCRCDSCKSTKKLSHDQAKYGVTIP